MPRFSKGKDLKSMNLNDFNFKEVGKNIFNNIDNKISSFIKELSDALEKEHKKTDMELKVEEGNVFVVCGLNDEKLILLNTENGKEFDIYISTSQEDLNNLHKQGIFSNIYEMEKKDFYNLALGSKLIMNNGSYKVYNGELDIKDADVWYRLNDMYGSIKEDEGKNFIVKNITEKEVFLSNIEGGGYFSIHREIYHDLEKGDIVKKNNGRYIKQ